jgi:hypothetical protein
MFVALYGPEVRPIRYSAASVAERTSSRAIRARGHARGRTWRALLRTNALLGLFCACTARREPSRAAWIPTQTRLEIGLHDVVPLEAEIGVVRSGRITSDGGVILVDYLEPFVRVFDRNGQYLMGFGRNGHRIGEYEDLTVAAASDSFLLTADKALRKIEVRRRDGSFVQSLDRIPLVPLSGVALGPRTWLLYGPSSEGVGNHDWLHCLKLVDGHAEWFSGYSVTQKNEAVLSQAPTVTAVGGIAVIALRLERDSLLLEAQCDAQAVRVVKREPLTAVVLNDSGKGNAEAAQILGLAAVSDGVVFSVLQNRQIGLRVHRSHVTSIGNTLTQDLIVLDGQPTRGILILQSDPVPHVFVLSDTALLMYSQTDRPNPNRPTPLLPQ